MSLSLFDLSDYPGNQSSYCKGIIQGSAGKKQSNNISGPEPSWSRSSYSCRWANLFWSLPTVASIYKVYLLLMDCLLRKTLLFFQASGDGGPFGFSRCMPFRSECEAFMEMGFLNTHLSRPLSRRSFPMYFYVQATKLVLQQHVAPRVSCLSNVLSENRLTWCRANDVAD